EPPLPGYSPRGMDIDRDGVVWAPLASGHFASFDRRKCKGPLNGPTATGKHCPEGWTFYPFPGPQLANVTDSGSAEASYYSWVDQHDTFGLGRNVPFATGNANESLLAFVDGRFVNLRVPYPMGFYAKGMDGRIDDPAAGWKGRGLWSTYGTRAPFHVEGGKGATSKGVKFQLRPDPLARGRPAQAGRTNAKRYSGHQELSNPSRPISRRPALLQRQITSRRPKKPNHGSWRKITGCSAWTRGCSQPKWSASSYVGRSRPSASPR